MIQPPCSPGTGVVVYFSSEQLQELRQQTQQQLLLQEAHASGNIQLDWLQVGFWHMTQLPIADAKIIIVVDLLCMVR